MQRFYVVKSGLPAQSRVSVWQQDAARASGGIDRRIFPGVFSAFAGLLW